MAEDRTAIENAYVKKNNFEWYKARDKFDAYLLLVLLTAKQAWVELEMILLR